MQINSISTSSLRFPVFICSRQRKRLQWQWQLWSWVPLNKRARKTEVLLAQNAQRVTVVSIDEEEQYSNFWCVEEYTEYIVASLWKSDPVQKVDQVRIDGMILSMRSDEWSWGIRPCGIIAFRQTLLLVGINREKQIQVTQIER